VTGTRPGKLISVAGISFPEHQIEGKPEKGCFWQRSRFVPEIGPPGRVTGGVTMPDHDESARKFDPSHAEISSGRRGVREKVFQNHERRVPLEREAKVRIMALARVLERRTEPGKHYGVLTGKFVKVLHALVWLIHDGKSGQCNPAYETIADKAGCCVKTVYSAIVALERAGILSWVHRITRIRVRERDLFGGWATSWRVVRTSNAYVFSDPKTAAPQGNPSKSKFYAGPPDRDLKNQLGEGADALLLRHGWHHGGGKGVQRA
jgi:Helix-turn-helix domain